MALFKIRIEVDTPELSQQMGRVADHLSRLVALLKRPRRPGFFTFSADTRRDGMLKFVLKNLPPLDGDRDFDVVGRELSVKVGEGPVAVLEVPAEAVDTLDSAGFVGTQGDLVHVELVNIDDAGNRSEPRVLEFSLQDTVAPAAPGEFSFLITEELPDAPPVEPEPTPEPEPEPTPEPPVE